jgi:hypothetical protein
MKATIRYAGLIFLCCCMASVAHAALFTFELGTHYGGVNPGAGNEPWLTATFEDVSSGSELNSVQLTMRVNNLNPNGYVSSWYFNTDYTGLLFSNFQSGIAAETNANPAYGNTNAGDALNFNLRFDFSGNAFNSGTSIYNLSGAGLLASNFNLTNDSGNGLYYSAALLTRNNSELASWIGADGTTPPPPTPVPEPATMLLLGLGLMGLALIGRRLH